MEKELISVIVPIYNIENYVRRCINSIINQTYANIEILLIDDGSVDNSGKICDEYKDERIKVFHKENGGLSDARNYGIDKSKGKYITTIDGDDYVDPNYIENLYNLLINSSADISSINRFDFIENEANGIISKVNYYEIKGTRIYSSEEYLKEIVKDRLPHEAWAKLYKREIFKKNLYEKNLKIYEDLEFLIRILKKEKLKIVCNTEVYGYYYRKRNNSLMTSSYDKYWENELKYYIKLIKNNDYIENRNDIENLLAGKIIRNYHKIIEQNEKYERIVFLRECTNYLKISKIKGKKNKIKIFLLKYFPQIIYFFSQLRKKDEKKFVIQFNKFIMECRKNDSKPAIIFNGPITGNLGDHAILFAEEKKLKEDGKEVFLISAKDMPYLYKYNLYNQISPKTEIYITGGGNTGSLWRNEQTRINQVLETFKDYKIVIFPQTIYYSEDDYGKECFEMDLKYYKKCTNIEFQCRDLKTYNYVTNNIGIHTIMSKDMVTTLDYKALNYNRKGILFCFRNDFEKNIDDKTKKELINKIINKYKGEKYQFLDTVLTKKKIYLYKDAKKEFNKIVKKFATSKLVVTDRLHGMLIAYITNTHCIALNNLSGKVKGVYETIKDQENKITFLEYDEINKIGE